jgi:hypothetical protein
MCIPGESLSKGFEQEGPLTPSSKKTLFTKSGGEPKDLTLDRRLPHQ